MSPRQRATTMLRQLSGGSAVRISQISRTLMGRMALLMARKRVREFASARYPDRPTTLRLRTSRMTNAKKREPNAIVQETRTSLTPIAAATGTDPTIPVRRTTSGRGNLNERSRHHLRIHQRLARNTARRNRNGEKSGARIVNSGKIDARIVNNE
jgi:hypothetical protein